jgi:hypothetical protein
MGKMHRSLFQAYRSDTRGPHAAESLYMIGLLYKGLSDKSRRKADHEAAMEYFRRVKRDFRAAPLPIKPVLN